MLSRLAISDEELRFVSIENLVEQQIGHIVLPQIYQKLGREIIITPVPGKRAEEELVRGRADGEIMRIYRYGDSVPNAVRVVPSYYHLQTMAFVKVSEGIKIRHPSAPANFSIAVVSGVKHTQNITQGLNNVHAVSSTEEMFRLLNRGMVDVALTNDLDGRIHLRKLGWDKDIQPAGAPLASLPLYHYLDIEHRELADELGETIERMQTSGELDSKIAEAESRVINRMLASGN